jgi:hypothetical protein
VRGLSGLAMAWASSKRPLPWRKGCRFSPAITRKNRRGTSSPWLAGLPRRNTRALDARGESSSIMALGGAAGEVACH